MAVKKPTTNFRIKVVEGPEQKKPKTEEVKIGDGATAKAARTKAAQEWITSERKTKSKREVMAKKKTATKKRSGPTGKKSGGETITSKIRKYAADHPAATKQEIADAVGTKYGNVHQALRKKKTKARGRKAGATKPSDHGTSSNNGHTASEFIKAGLGLGLDKAIELLTAVKKAIG